MKRAIVALVWALGMGVPSLWGQSYPAVLTVVKEVEVRSGPTKEYHPTMVLKVGDRVLVRHISKDQPTWLAIAPPLGSFSWINAKNVKQPDAKTGFVIGEANEQIDIKPGSSVSGAAPISVSIKVKPGYQFAILGPPLTNDGVTWLPITPHPDENRFIPADAVQAGFGGSVLPAGGAGAPANTLITQADQAYIKGNVEQAKALYKDAAERTADFQQKSYCYNRLASLSQGSWGTNPAGHPAQSNGPPAQLASRTIPAPESKWSQWGVLRNTAYEKDGQPMYVLENDRGQPIVYVTTTSGFSLRGYLGKMVAMYGPLNYHNQIRAYYMTASHVAENNR